MKFNWAKLWPLITALIPHLQEIWSIIILSGVATGLNVASQAGPAVHAFGMTAAHPGVVGVSLFGIASYFPAVMAIFKTLSLVGGWLFSLAKTLANKAAVSGIIIPKE